MCPHSKTRALSLFVLVILLFVPLAGAVSNTDGIKESHMHKNIDGVKESHMYKAPKNEATKSDLFEELKAKAELYNQNLDKVPAIVKKLIGSNEIVGKIKLNNGETLCVTVITNNGKETCMYDHAISNPSITVKTDENTVRKVLDSNHPFKEAFKSIKDGSVKVKPSLF